MGRVRLVEEDRSFYFGAVADCARVAQDDSAAQIGSVADGALFPDDAGPLDKNSWLEEGTRSDRNPVGILEMDSERDFDLDAIRGFLQIIA